MGVKHIKKTIQRILCPRNADFGFLHANYHKNQISSFRAKMGLKLFRITYLVGLEHKFKLHYPFYFTPSMFYDSTGILVQGRTARVGTSVASLLLTSVLLFGRYNKQLLACGNRMWEQNGLFSHHPPGIQFANCTLRELLPILNV